VSKPDTGIVDIHGKSYQTVALRVRNFREKHPNYRLITEIQHRDEECVVMLARIADENGNVLATGHSEEYRSDGQINRTSALENSETSAIGRALAALGMGGTEFASADEVARAVSGQKPPAKSVAADVWDTMDTPAQIKLQGIADHARSKIDAGDVLAAVDIIEKENLDADSKVALWSRFNSKERSAMKAAQKKAA
jgi:hypothetical protein